MRIVTVVAVFVCAIAATFHSDAESRAEDKPPKTFDQAIDRNAGRMLEEGRQIFRCSRFHRPPLLPPYRTLQRSTATGATSRRPRASIRWRP